MSANTWFLIIGLLLVSLAFATPFFERLPVSLSIFYLAIGLLLGPGALGVLSWDIVRDARLFERVTEIAVLVSLFTVGLNMRRSATDRMWFLPVRLATVTMVITIAAIAAAGVFVMGLPLGAAVLLGAVLAPTDPVLASDVQMQHATDQDSLRYGISGEAGLNDGTAFPFVMLGLGLLGLHPEAPAGPLGLWQGSFSLLAWLGWDLVWAVVVGLLVGGVTGWIVGKGALMMQQHRNAAFSLHEFLVLGLIGLAYGLAELLYGYGFLAVFAAGYALRYIELSATGHAPEPAELPAVALGDKHGHLEVVADEPKKAAQFLAVSLLDFNDKLEHLLSAAVVILLGGVLTTQQWAPEALWLAPLLFFVARPISVMIGLAGSDLGRLQRALIGWFGIRGIGSIYYLTYALEHGVEGALAERLTSIVLSIVAISIVVHGLSVSPIMTRYEQATERPAGQPQPSPGGD